jgi:glucose/arabinose dehydrogenase
VKYSLIISLCTILAASAAIAADPATKPATKATAPPPKKERPDDSKQPWGQMQYGSLLTATWENRAGSKEYTHKGIAITVSQSPQARVIFDTELLRYSVAWTDGFMNFTNVVYDGSHGTMPSPNGKILWAVTGQHPGISLTGKFDDPRPQPYGPLPRETWGHYKGLFRNGRQVILNYSIGDCDALDMPGFEMDHGQPVFTRFLEIGPSKQTIWIVLAESPTPPSTLPTTSPAFAPQLQNVTVGDVAGLEVTTEHGRQLLKIPPHDDVKRIESQTCAQIPGQAWNFEIATNRLDLRSLCHGGEANWPQTIETKGSLGSGDHPYVVDTIPVPENNPYHSWMRLGGMDFFSDGHRAAVCTWNGDVWIVSGIDEKLDHVTWKRYAAGLFQTLGLKIVKDDVYVLGRDQITHLRDLNGDGEADQYENFNNDVMAAESFHEFNFDLQCDSKGYFYFAKAGAVNPGGRGWQRITPHNGCMFRISPDGKDFEVFATGLRAPNGTSCGPHDEITVSDNQGTWVPVCRLDVVSRGKFLGVPDNSHLNPVPTNWGDPICWFPYPDVDNSSGGGVWVTSDKWGPFRDRLLHTSYGQCSLFLVMVDQVDNQVQGGVVKFPDLDFASGIDRARINPVDGQVYLVGLKGWQTRAAKDACFQRVRYTGKSVNMPTSFHVKENGVELGFTQPVDPETAGDPDSYDVEQWNYIWSKNYGSPEVHVDDPAEKGRQPVKVTEARVSPDHKHVLLVMPDIEPVMQMKIAMNIDAADSSEMKYEIDATINRVPNFHPRTRAKPTTASTQPTASAK